MDNSTKMDSEMNRSNAPPGPDPGRIEIWVDPCHCLRPDDTVLSFSAASHYEAAWLYSQHCLSKAGPFGSQGAWQSMTLQNAGGRKSRIPLLSRDGLRLQDSFGALLSLGLSEGAASSGKVEEVKKALTNAFWQIMDAMAGPLWEWILNVTQLSATLWKRYMYHHMIQ